ncbi:hypothetical protein DPEC_G00113900 [Dallia pectoralis]|uniref:Uncharacterized protein n=1 Tax=Dallia pectoralis TaxID=75939 RepID=A0ACC2GTQ4_DALPE|nr:hypothetical protein DPEC_G00113900 [Dallia pectoralis]
MQMVMCLHTCALACTVPHINQGSVTKPTGNRSRAGAPRGPSHVSQAQPKPPQAPGDPWKPNSEAAPPTNWMASGDTIEDCLRTSGRTVSSEWTPLEYFLEPAVDVAAMQGQDIQRASPKTPLS